jgi:homoserine O-acetyltransferase
MSNYKLFKFQEKFTLENGEELEELQIAYHTYGKINADRSNVVWVCHALTANSDVFDWWQGVFGENAYFNPREHFIVCANIIGSCYGTTGPLTANS